MSVVNNPVAPKPETFGYGADLRKLEFGPMFGVSTVNQGLNLHKILCTPVILFSMYYHENFTLPAYLYLLAHGTYSIMWLVKYATFPPKNFEKQHSIPELISLLVFTGLYWLAPWVLCKNTTEISTPLMIAALSIYQAGIFLHYVADCQLHYTLLYRGPGLVTSGLYARTRNPGYLGEILIYIGFALLCQHWLPWCVNMLFWCTLFRDNMNKKDASISRHAGWEQYKIQTWQLIPKITGADLVSLFKENGDMKSDENSTGDKKSD